MYIAIIQSIQHILVCSVENMTAKKHFLLVHFPAFGHIIPLMDLGKKLLQQGHKVTALISKTFVPMLIDRGIIVSSKFDNIRVVTVDDGIPADRQLPNQKEGLARIAHIVDMAYPILQNILREMPIGISDTGRSSATEIEDPVDVVIGDRFYTTVVISTAAERNIPVYVFNSLSGFSFAERMNLVAPRTGNPERNSEDAKTAKSFIGAMNSVTPLATGFIFNSFREANPLAYHKIAEHPLMKNTEILCMGPLFAVETFGNETNPSIRLVKEWLNLQDNRSVIYVSFGTVIGLSAEQINEIFDALLALGSPFILSLKPKMQAFLPVEVQETLKSQFDDQTKRYLVLSWVPQKLVLSHPAANVFVTHAGISYQ